MGSRQSSTCQTQNSMEENEITIQSHRFKEGIPWERTKGKNPFKYYAKISKLGRGSMGAVILVRKKKKCMGRSAYLFERKQNNKMMFSMLPFNFNSNLNKKKGNVVSSLKKKDFAMKSIILRKVSDDLLEELANEISILRKLDHPYIVKLYEIYDYNHMIYLVMELCSGGDLWSRSPYTELQAATIVKKLISAIAYMHRIGITHRDIKMENIMFENESPESEIKLLDFGLSRKFQPGEFMYRGVGTVYTMAPEVIKGNYTSMADLWSVGVITYVLLSNQKPFNGLRRKEVLNKILNCDYNFDNDTWNCISDQAKNFIQELLEPDETKRLTGEGAIQHEWLTKRPLSKRTSLYMLDDEFMSKVNKRIEYHAENNLLKRIGLYIIAHKSSADEIMKLRQAFRKYDTNNDGVICFDDFKSGMEKFGQDGPEIKAIFDKMSLDGDDSVVHYSEFIAATLETLGYIKEEKIADAFERIDCDNTGYISKRNIMDILGADYDPDLVNETMEEVDDDKDGQISFKDFRRVFARRASMTHSELKDMNQLYENSGNIDHDINEPP